MQFVIDNTTYVLSDEAKEEFVYLGLDKGLEVYHSLNTVYKLAAKGIARQMLYSMEKKVSGEEAKFLRPNKNEDPVIHLMKLAGTMLLTQDTNAYGKITISTKPENGYNSISSISIEPTHTR